MKNKFKTRPLIAFLASVFLLLFYLFYFYPRNKDVISENVSLIIAILIPLLYSLHRLIVSKNEE